MLLNIITFILSLRKYTDQNIFKPADKSEAVYHAMAAVFDCDIDRCEVQRAHCAPDLTLDLTTSWPSDIYLAPSLGSRKPPTSIEYSTVVCSVHVVSAS